MATRPTEKTLDTRPAPAGRMPVRALAQWPPGRSIWLIALALIGLAAGFWAYRYLRHRAVDVDALSAQAEQDFVSGRYDRVDVALQRLRRIRPASPLDHMLRTARGGSQGGPTRPLKSWRSCPMTTTWHHKLDCWPGRSN